ncbi:MAG: nucleoside hydrolase, partial [Planctomycetes bacterium]|nr:nucleoside hydrolase [Planctomycetota bacterium]
AARAVFAAGIPIVLAPLDTTGHLGVKKPERDRLFAARTAMTYQMQNLYELWGNETPVLFDPLAVALVFEEKHCKFQDLSVTIDDKGMTITGEGKVNCRVAMTIDDKAFINWWLDRIVAHGKMVPTAAPKNLSTLIPQSGFPTKVHCFEDYDTDIEKRWWMSGKGETKDVPPSGKRCCRAVLTQDFDDRQGDTKTMYRAVIFNPVPGPPMGPNTRLSFRYKLHGTDKMRVQLYSLTNGYHRYLSLEGVKQDEWRHGTVDMTKMLRPDGSGGALAENERIDDIQFYVDPTAELLIDDVILYDAAREGEKRPFPARVLYTGLFDTGKQGKEWPGDFTIVEYPKPKMWKYAKSVTVGDSNPIIRLSMRGERTLDTPVELFFKYRLTGTDEVTVEVGNAKTKFVLTQELKNLKKDEWTETTASFKLPEGTKETTIDEICFRLPKGAELWIDDVLLYVPGK